MDAKRVPTEVRTRLGVERLEDRATPANIAVLGSTLQPATAIRLTYQASDVPSFEVAVYRSADGVVSADDVLITTATVTPGATTDTQAASIALGGELPLDPNRPRVLVVADPGNAIAETNEGDNLARFRKLSLAVIAHGLQSDGQLPAWVGQMADGLRAAGFDRVVAIDWAAASRLPVAGQAVLAGARLAQRVRDVADALGKRPTDVVDVQFIGHSRGTVVVSRALLNLEVNPGPRELRLGYYEVTLLDPHPARNRGSLLAGYVELTNGTGVSTIGGFSFDPTNLASVAAARGTLLFQSLSVDPFVKLPANVDHTELFYQRLAWDETTPGGFEYATRLNIWGERLGDINNQSGHEIDAIYIPDTPTGGTTGHTSVQTWYIDNYLP